MIELFGDPPEDLYEDVSEEERKCGHELKGWSAIPEKKDIDPTCTRNCEHEHFDVNQELEVICLMCGKDLS